MCFVMNVKSILPDPDSLDVPPCLRAYLPAALRRRYGMHRQGLEKEISRALQIVDFGLRIDKTTWIKR